MASNVPPMPQAGMPGPKPKKGVNPAIWILLGVAGFIFLIVLAGSLFIVHKIKQAGFDATLARKNPGVAMAKWIIAANPDLELISVDENRGIVIIHDKKKGATVRLSLEDIQMGKFTAEGPNGEKVSLGPGAAFKPPSWLPIYPGSHPIGSYSEQNADGDAGVFQFTTKDCADQVKSFYDSNLAGIKFTRVENGTASVLAGSNKNDRHSATVTITPSAGGTQVNVVFKAKR